STMGDEMNSPRGRIFLIKETLEGRINSSDIEPFIDNCLGCLACVTSCPSGVEYGELITPYRDWAESKRKRSTTEKLQRFALLKTIPHPTRFRAASKIARIFKPIARYLPKGFGAMMELAPTELPPEIDFKDHYPALGQQRGRVALLIGCAQQALAPRINAVAIRVLTRNGIEVVVPKSQGCCGSLAMHIGESQEALQAARKNFDAFPTDIDAVITTAAGCGSGMKEYPHLFAGQNEDQQTQANAFSSKVMDICEYLDSIGFIPPKKSESTAIKVAYQDACHLAHAQKIRSAPRKLLKSVPGIEVLEPNEWEICCGSAGSYNIEHQDTAKILGQRKVSNLYATRADLIATGNIGCLTQIEFHSKGKEDPIPVVHTIELLDGEI
ncbi:MAG: heterodisulfide reductase-related iron-sulfur binding cluster, partial [Opitutales bacterium]|nr:heterodisulfide reductase-related iron-sulfur binding cluster [Opitutales bacterium]